MFQVTTIHQIEITSKCNLRCRYCVHPTMSREKLDMSEATFQQTLKLTRALMSKFPGRQRELNLAGIGESTMHPDFVRFVHLARECVGPRVSLVLATNGLLVTRELAAAIAPANPDVYVSLHRPEKAAGAVQALQDFGLYRGASTDPALNSVDWAGQVKWQVSSSLKGTPCPWVRGGWAIALADGRLSRCCFDGTASDTIGTVWDAPANLKTAPYSLCATCHLDVGVPLQQEAQVKHALKTAQVEGVPS